MRKGSLTLALALLAILLGTAGAVKYDQVQVEDTLNLRRHAIVRGDVMFKGAVTEVVQNSSTTDTLDAFEVVFRDTTRFTIVTKIKVGDGDKTCTVADSGKYRAWAYEAIDTQVGGVVQYDTSKVAQFRVRALFTRQSGKLATDTNYVIIQGYDKYYHALDDSIMHVGVADLDTTMPINYASITAVRATGTDVEDSIEVYGYFTNGVAVGTPSSPAASQLYAGVIQERILPRHRGKAAWAGESKVKLDASSTVALAGYWLTPSSSSGYATASGSKPNMAIGYLTDFSEFDSAWSAHLLWDLSGYAEGTMACDTLDADYITTGGGGGYFGIAGDTWYAEQCPLVLHKDSTFIGALDADSVPITLNTFATEAAACSTWSNAGDLACSTYTQDEALACSTWSNAGDLACSTYAQAVAAADSAYAQSAAAACSSLTAGWFVHIVRPGAFLYPTNGPADYQLVEGTNLIYDVADFDASTEESAYCTVNAPHSYAGGVVDIDTLYVTIGWMAASASTEDVVWGISASAWAATEAVDAAYTVRDTVHSANNGTGQVNYVTKALSLGMATNQFLPFKIVREAGEAADDLAADARLLGVSLRFNNE